ncbi:MAG TPA: SCO family protein [Thermoanaerobaculia bacterium]|nr:SCO family protein [Thermoanaerobaculia bacterium]
MRIYLLSAVIAALGVAMLAGAAVIAYQQPDPVAEVGDRAAVRGGEVWGADWFPNVPLVTHDGESVRFFDDLIEGKVVAINFIYTSCPDTCPVETARLMQVAELLGDRLGEDVFFYSITIDPDYDTQPVLKAFADSWDLPEGWKFLTGNEEDLVLLRTKLGVRIEDVERQDFAAHEVSLVIGNQTTGRWMKRSPFENPYVLAEQLGSWLHGWKLARTADRDYADAPEIRQISTGEDLFRTRCAACHTVGRGDVRQVAQRRIGPDLYAVGERRDRAWLERWLKEPDAMLAEGDPLAVAMKEEWNGVPMPNLRLTDNDVTAILGYIDQESYRITELRRAQTEGGDAHAGMDHTGMDHSGMDHSGDAAEMDHDGMDHSGHDMHAEHAGTTGER